MKIPAIRKTPPTINSHQRRRRFSARFTPLRRWRMRGSMPRLEASFGRTASLLPSELTAPLSYPTRAELERRFPLGDPDEFLVDLEHVRGGDFDERPAHPVTISNPFYIAIR